MEIPVTMLQVSMKTKTIEMILKVIREKNSNDMRVTMVTSIFFSQEKHSFPEFNGLRYFFLNQGQRGKKNI